jgi:hypothetical protein
MVRETKEIVDDTLDKLKRLDAQQPGAHAGVPQYFFVVSRRSRFIVDIPLTRTPTVDLDGILLSIYEFMNEQPMLEQGNVYLTKLGADSILVETFGDTLFAQAFSREIDRPHYKAFHRAVKHVQKTFPHMGIWDGTPETLPPGFKSALGQHFGTGPGQHIDQRPAATVLEPAPGRPERAPGTPEPDIQDCERKMREWYRKGYRIDRLKVALHSDWQTIVDAFEAYESDVALLESLRERARKLERPGLEEDIRKIRPLLEDPSRVGELEQAVETLEKKARDSMMIKLPVSQPDALARAIKELPLGIPSSLWGIPLDRLVDEFLAAERGLAPDGSVLVSLRSVWYYADARGKSFMTPFSGPVRTQKEMLESDDSSVVMDSIVDDILKNGK